MNTTAAVKRILIIQTAFIGDVILTLPLLQLSRKTFPNAEIDFIAIPAAKSILQTHEDVNELIIYDKRDSDRGIKQFHNMVKKLRGKQYDLALVPHRSLRSATLAFLSRATQRIGFHRSAGKFLLTDIIPYPADGTHEINRNLHLLKPFQIDPSKKVYPRLSFSDEDEAIVEKWLERNVPDNSKRVVTIAPGSVWNTKRWLPERFSEVADLLTDEGFKVVLIGGPADVELAGQIISLSRSPIANAVGEMSIRQSALLIKKSMLLLTNDSAPMHLAVSVGIRVVAIFGPTITGFGFYPYGEKDIVIETDGLSCRPCGNHGGNACPIKTFDCMKNITSETVANEVLSIIRDAEVSK